MSYPPNGGVHDPNAPVRLRSPEAVRETKIAPRAVCLLRAGLKSFPKGMTPDNQRGHRCDYRPLAQAEQPSFGGGQNEVIGLPLVEIARVGLTELV